MALTQIKTDLIANSAVTQSKIDPNVELGGAAVTTSATAPTSPTPSTGDLWYNTTTGKLSVYYNAGWVVTQLDQQGIGSRVVDVFTATASQTVFTTSAGYSVGYVDVYVNGIKLLPADFTATNATTVTLGSGADLNDEVVIISWTLAPGVVSFVSDIFTGNGTQTVYTLSVTPSNENQTTVVIDGVNQIRNTYSVSGAALTFSEAPGNGAVIEVTTAKGSAFLTTSYNDLTDKPDLTGLGIKISNIQVTDSGGTVLDDTAVDIAGGYIKLTGSGFLTGCQVLINNIPATSTTFVSSTVVRAQVPATAAGTYIVYLVNPDGGVGIRVNGVTFSATPSWVTGSSLEGNVDTALSLQLSATGASTFALQSGSTLPTGLTLSSGGLISGTVTGLTQETVYSFTVIATDAENQDSPRTFSITITVGDQYFNRTVLAINADADTFVSDASTNNFPITVAGDTRPSNFSPYNTNWSLYQSAIDANYLNFGSGDWTFSGDFTIDGWVYYTSASSGDGSFYVSSDGSLYLAFNISMSAGVFNIYINSGSPTSSISHGIVANQWTHVAMVRSGSTITMYTNGVSKGTITSSATIGFNNPTINRCGGGVGGIERYISNLRILRGTAINFSTAGIPTSPVSVSTSNQILLTAYGNRFADFNTTVSAKIVTLSGSLKITSFSPFTETDTTTGSGYFDGTGDSLSIAANNAFNVGTNDACVECWVYFNSTASNQTLNGQNSGANSTMRIGIWSGVFQYTINDDTLRSSGVTALAGQWYHLALTITGGTTRYFINGILRATATGFTVNSRNETYFIGSEDSTSQILNGYMRDFRFTNGSIPVAYQTSSTTTGTQIFNVPTEPLTAVANTQILTLQNRQPVNNHSFIDTSGITTPMVKVGSSSQGSFSPYSPAGWSNYFDGSGDYLSYAVNSAFALGAGDCTIECWYYPVSRTTPYGRILQGGLAGWATTDNWALVDRHADNITKFQFAAVNINGNPAILVSSTVVQNNVWYHLAVTRSGNTFRLFVNGVQESTYTTSTALTTSATVGGYVGGTGSGDAESNGYISNVRILKGTALYTSTFTPPTSPLTAIANTSLLTCQSNRFIDNSTNNFAITRNGDAAVVNFSPFKPTAQYSRTTHGGSVYFDGDADYLYNNIANNLLHLNNNFTVEAWVYMIPKSLQILFNTTPHTTLAISLNRTGIGDTWVFVGNGSGSWLASPSINSNNVSKNLQLNSWNHVALVRNGATITLYHNGEVAGTTTNLPSGFSGGGIYIGSYNSAGTFGEYFKGYMSGFRIVNGTAIYTAAFTPPTTPPSNVSGTVMLLNYSDAAIVDVSSRNVMETVGDAKIVSSTRKYGTGSMYFDGTGDYLASYSDLTKANCTFRTGDFTIEAWVNFATVGSNLGIADTATSTTTASSSQWYLYRISTNLIGFGNHGGGAIISSTTTTLASTWYHVAVTRSGTSLRLFVNGVLESTVTNSTDYIAASLHLGLIGTPYLMNGYIDDFRITKGVARYTANFTPPTSTFLVR